MPFGIIIEGALEGVPADVDTELRARLQEIAVSLEVPPKERPSVSENKGCLNVKGWRFEYRIETRKGALVVESAQFKGE